MLFENEFYEIRRIRNVSHKIIALRPSPAARRTPRAPHSGRGTGVSWAACARASMACTRARSTWTIYQWAGSSVCMRPETEEVIGEVLAVLAC